MQSRAFSGLPVIGLLTLGYFIAGKFGLMLASLHASASPVWPPAGIALAALLVLGYRVWPAIFVGAFLVNVTTAGNVATSLAVASGNTLEAVCGAWLVNRFAGGTTVFDRPQGVFKFALAAVVSTIISPAFGVTSLALAGFADWMIYGAISLFGTLHGFGPFVGEAQNQSLLALQSWTAVLTISAMALSAGMAERRRAEEALRESEAHVSLAANAANLGLWFWNIRDDKLWVTEKWRRLFGFAESEPVSFDRVLQVVHPEDRERTKQLVQQMFEGGGGEYENEYRITRPDGSTRWMAGHGSVELDECGKPAFARGMSRDITLRKQAEDALRESEERFRTVANAAPVMIWMSGTDKACTFFNKGWLDFTGRKLEQELGNGWANGVHREDFDRWRDIYGNSFDARQPFTMEYRLRRSDGEYRWVLESGTPRLASDGAFLGYIGSCIDITERKRGEEKFRLVLDAAP